MVIISLSLFSGKASNNFTSQFESDVTQRSSQKATIPNYFPGSSIANIEAEYKCLVSSLIL